MGRVELADHSKAFFLALDDGEWHDLDDVYEQISEAISDERVGLEKERLQRHSRNPSFYDDKPPALFKKRVGQSVLSAAQRNEYVEREDNKIRLTTRGRLQALKARGYKIEPPQKSRYSMWTKKLFAIMGDGEWHDRETVVQEVSVVVPPETAHRFSIRTRESHGRKRGHAVHPEQGDPIRTGQRRIAYATITNAIKRGSIIEEGGKIRAAIPWAPGYRLGNNDASS